MRGKWCTACYTNGYQTCMCSSADQTSKLRQKIRDLEEENKELKKQIEKKKS